jgi:osmotically-inducible protein OsmY
MPDQLQEQIERKLAENTLVDECRVHVQVDGGRVRLEGIATTRYARTRAEDLAREVEGVTEVDNHIAIQPSTEAGEPVLTLRDPDRDNEPSTQRS